MALSLLHCPLCFPFIFLLLIALPPTLFLVDAVPLVGSDLVHLLRDHAPAQSIQRTKMNVNGSEAGGEVPFKESAPSSSSTLPHFTSTTTTTSPLIPSSPPSSSNSSAPSDASARLLCQFFIFSTLFGSVCTISACTCLFRTRRSLISSSQQRRVASVEDSSISRLVRIREPFGPDKPYCLKFDEKGLCYASPLTREVPPLPTYEDACKMLSLAELLANCGEPKDGKEPGECVGDAGGDKPGKEERV